jgi:transcriptional regulator with XRE-family HTH domain
MLTKAKKSSPRRAPAKRKSSGSVAALGARLRELRLSRGFSQRALARMSGLTHATISMIEADKIDSSLGTLKKLLNACNVKMWEFFQQDESGSVVTLGESIVTIRSKGVRMRYVAPRTKNRLLEITQEIYEPGADTGKDVLAHEGQEGGIILRGTFELILGNAKHVLKSGDSYYFSSIIPHRFRNIGEEEGELINAASPPTF